MHDEHNLFKSLSLTGEIIEVVLAQTASAPTISLTPTMAFGLSFRNPIGLAAGMDRDGRYLDLWHKLGFGFVEVGTISPEPSVLKAAPSILQLHEHQALAHSGNLGSAGAVAVAKNLSTRPEGLVVGISLGKRGRTPILEAGLDLLRSFEILQDHADYVALNTRWPLTPKQVHPEPAEHLSALVTPVISANAKRNKTLPILLKISPDLNPEQFRALHDLSKELGIYGFILGNSSREPERILGTDYPDSGITGAPLFQNTLSQLAAYQAFGSLAIVAAGGISSPNQALEVLSSGASLVQLYSGLVYQGPNLLWGILKGLQKA